jgi:hypothetical protein
MALITATWRVTLKGEVLLDWPDLTEGEPRLASSFISDRFAAFNSDGIGMRAIGRSNVSHTASFARVRIFDSDVEARNFMQRAFEEAPVGPGYLEIQWQNSAGTTITNCALTGFNARTENNFFMADYTLQGGVLIPNSPVDASAAGNSDVFLYPPGFPFLGVYVTGGAGGLYTHTVSLLAGNNPGDIADVYISLNAVDGPTIEIYDITPAGTLLYSVTAATFDRTEDFERFTWDGTAWSLT